MAMGQRGRSAAERALRNHAQFKNSTGSFCATLGSARELGWLRSHPQADYIRGLLRDAAYVVWSYGTPIGWVAEDEDGSFERFYVDVSHTTTTSAHQGILRTAWGEYETIGERQERRRTYPRRARGSRPESVIGPNFRTSGDSYRPDYAAQDDLMDEVAGYVHPAHP